MSILDAYRLRNPGYSVPHIFAYTVGWYLIRTSLTLLYDMRAEGGENVPRTGGLLVVGNHQSNFDPPMMAVACRRHFHFMAKQTLWEHRRFGWLIHNFNAIPIDQQKGDTGAIKAAIDRLQKGGIVLIYPEGSRTHDGAINPFKRGTALLIRRAKVPVLPIAIEGLFDVWPRWQRLPHLFGHVRAKVGPVVPYEELAAAGSDGMLDLLKTRLDDMRLELRKKIRASSRGRYPASGPGDYRWDDPVMNATRVPDPDP